ncbi:hypothetical protein CRG98_018115 [Punica granatum]|uniref:Uncharacterized protein n=1 Tax=Punica granatum TaxID=22663 RepID=A0A2I0K049_PUNGR|nr:hypothetical protein CRG98_018115 [Punica granatum]
MERKRGWRASLEATSRRPRLGRGGGQSSTPFHLLQPIPLCGGSPYRSSSKGSFGGGSLAGENPLATLPCGGDHMRGSPT